MNDGFRVDRGRNPQELILILYPFLNSRRTPCGTPFSGFEDRADILKPFLSFFKAFFQGFLSFFKAFFQGSLSFFPAFLDSKRDRLLNDKSLDKQLVIVGTQVTEHLEV